MATRVILPMLGQTMEEGTIIKWFKREGETVSKGEPLLEVMTDKVNMEVESPESGVLRKIIAQPDETVPVMALIGVIGTADEPIDDILTEQPPAPPQAEPQAGTSVPTPSTAVLDEPSPQPAPVQPATKVFLSPRARKLAAQHGIPIAALAGLGTGPGGRVVEKDIEAYVARSAEMVKTRVTPLAARIASDHGIDVREVIGSGPQGKVTREDVLRAVAPASGLPGIEAKVIPLAGIRKLVAENVARSAQTAPHVTLTSEVDVTELVKLREQVLKEFELKYATRLTYTDLIVKAVARALLDHPIANSSLQGNEIRVFSDVNIGLAVAIEGGLVVPVVKNADRKALPQISTEIKALVDKARSGSLTSDDISGGTFSITNLGTYGVDVFNPVITPGQSAILGVCRISEKPVVREGRVEVRSVMNLCLSFDHRVMDGAPAAQFLARIKELLESPYQLLI